MLINNEEFEEAKSSGLGGKPQNSKVDRAVDTDTKQSGIKQGTINLLPRNADNATDELVYFSNSLAKIKCSSFSSLPQMDVFIKGIEHELKQLNLEIPEFAIEGRGREYYLCLYRQRLMVI